MVNIDTKLNAFFVSREWVCHTSGTYNILKYFFGSRALDKCLKWISSLIQLAVLPPGL